MPLRKGDGTPVTPKNIQEIRRGDGTVLWTPEVVAWKAASDWDNAAAQDPNVVHEAYGDLPGDDVIQLGYPSTDPNGSDLVIHVPSDEDSGSVLSNEAGSPDFDISGATLGSTGAFGTDAPNYDGTDDYTVARDLTLEGAGQFTFFAICKFDTIDGSGNHRIISRHANTEDYVAQMRIKNGNLQVEARENANSNIVNATGATSISTDTWYRFAATIDAANDTVKVFVNGSEDGSGTGTLSGSDSAWTDDGDEGWAVAHLTRDSSISKSEFVDGVVEYPHVFHRTLSDTEISNMSSLSGTLTTATKSFSSDAKPDLQNLSYSLNGGSITLDIIGSPGTASEEVVSQQLDGATEYSLSWSNLHTDFRMKPKLSSTDAETTPVFNGGELVA